MPLDIVPTALLKQELKSHYPLSVAREGGMIPAIVLSFPNGPFFFSYLMSILIAILISILILFISSFPILAIIF